MKKIFSFLMVFLYLPYPVDALSYYKGFLFNRPLVAVITRFLKGASFANTAAVSGQNENQQRQETPPAESTFPIRQLMIDEIDLFSKGNWAFLFTTIEDRVALWDHVFKMIADGLSINTKDENKRTFLFYITQEDDIKYMRRLIKSGIDVHATDKYGRTAFDSFCENLFKGPFTVSQFEYVQEFVDRKVELKNIETAEKIFRMAISTSKMLLAQKVSQTYQISNDYKNSLLFELNNNSELEGHLNFNVDILHKNSMGETFIDFSLKQCNFEVLEILLKKFAEKFTNQQKTNSIQAALDKGRISFVVMMSKEHPSAFTSKQIDQSVIKAVENYDYFNVDTLINNMGEKISDNVAKKVFRELILRNSLSLATKINNLKNISKEYKNSLLFDLQKKEQLIVLLNFDIDVRFKNAKKERCIDMWLQRKYFSLLEFFLEKYPNEFTDEQFDGTMQIAFDEKKILFVKNQYNNQKNRFTEKHITQSIQIGIEKGEIVFLQRLKNDFPTNFTEHDNSEFERLKIADAKNKQIKQLLGWGTGTAIVIGFIYFFISKSQD